MTIDPTSKMQLDMSNNESVASLTVRGCLSLSGPVEVLITRGMLNINITVRCLLSM